MCTLQAARNGHITWKAQADALQMLALQCLFVPLAMFRRFSQNARHPAHPAPIAPTRPLRLPTVNIVTRLIVPSAFSFFFFFFSLLYICDQGKTTSESITERR